MTPDGCVRGTWRSTMKMALYVDIGVFGRLSRFPCVYLTTEALLIFVISNWYVFAVLHYRSLEGTNQGARLSGGPSGA